METLSTEERARVVIASKWLPLPTPRNPFLFTPGLVSGLKKSLARLGVESIDLYQVNLWQASSLCPRHWLMCPLFRQIHGPIGYHSWASQARELAECVKLGLCKAGTSRLNPLCNP
jgi:aryl-alcohol dehydrogenase-like predicted oxidoreductase